MSIVNAQMGLRSDVELVDLWARFAAAIGIPKRLRTASLPGPDRESTPTPAIERVVRYLDKEFLDGACLVLAGATGVGKSFAAAAALRAVSNTETPLGSRAFFYFPALAGAFLDPERRSEALERAKSTEFLVLDDFGVEYVKEGGLVEAFTDEVVWYRESEILPTLITTNLTSEQLRSRLSDRIIDRFRGEWSRVFAVPGESLRGPAR